MRSSKDSPPELRPGSPSNMEEEDWTPILVLEVAAGYYPAEEVSFRGFREIIRSEPTLHWSGQIKVRHCQNTIVKCRLVVRCTPIRIIAFGDCRHHGLTLCSQDSPMLILFDVLFGVSCYLALSWPCRSSLASFSMPPHRSPHHKRTKSAKAPCPFQGGRNAIQSLTGSNDAFCEKECKTDES